MQHDFNLTPAQNALVDKLATSGGIVAVDTRRYTLDGEPVHWATVEALERRGVLRRDGDRLTVARPNDAPPARDVVRCDDVIVLGDDDTPPALIARDESLTPERRALRHAQTAHDAAVRARDAVVRARSSARDESVFGRVWRRLAVALGG